MSSLKALAKTRCMGFKYSEEQPHHTKFGKASAGNKRKHMDDKRDKYEDPAKKGKAFDEFWETLKASLKRSNNSFGACTIETDVSLLMAWALFATGGALSKSHHDGGSLCTYVICRKGLKLWSFVESDAGAQ